MIESGRTAFERNQAYLNVLLYDTQQAAKRKRALIATRTLADLLENGTLRRRFVPAVV